MNSCLRPLMLVIALLSTACPSAPGNEGEAGSSGQTSSESGGSEGSLGSCEGQVYVSGSVTREMTDTTWNEPFAPTAEAHVHLELSDFILDGASTALVERDVPFESLPFDFVICADADAIEEQREGQLIVDVRVFNHAGTDIRVGDLVSEYLNEIEGASLGVELLVSGIEHCDDPSAGGFCTTNEGP